MRMAIFVMAKYSSERLYGKVMLDMNGMPVLEILIRRLLKTGIPIYILATDSDEDRRYIKPIADKYGVTYDEHPIGNPVKQQYFCLLKHKLDWIVNIDADDMFSCADTVLRVYNAIGSQDYITTRGLPLGMNVFAYNRRVLDGIDFNLNTGWGDILSRRNRLELVYHENLYHDFRLTLDYPCDADTFKMILTECKHNDIENGLIMWLKTNKDKMVNAAVNKEYWENHNRQKGENGGG